MEKGISLCIIVKNEEKNLEKCLNSVKNLVNEIIILDTGSIDKTKEIAREFTGKLFDFKWNNNFSDARNFSISQASKEWILILDADEIISEKDHREIKNIIKESKTDAFVLKCRNYTHNFGVVGWAPSNNDYKESSCAPGFWILSTIRLFKNKKDFFFEGAIHETIYNSIKRAGGKILDTDIVIHHFGELDKQKLSDKKNIYTGLLKKRLENQEFTEKPKDYIYYELAGELIKINNIKEAITCLEAAININKKLEYLLQLGGLYILENKLDEAERILKKAALLDPVNSSIYNNLGIVYSEKGEYNKAIRKFEKAIELNPKSADAFFNLGIVYRKKGKISKMKYFFEKAIELNPRYLEKIESLN